MAAACAAARQRRLLCSPSVGPGFDARRAGMAHIPVVPPAAGARYDAMWSSAFAAGADVVSITSWNEWHEGTQIEPAKPYCFPSDGYCSPGYEGAYGRSGPAARTAYMDRSAFWADELPDPPLAPADQTGPRPSFLGRSGSTVTVGGDAPKGTAVRRRCGSRPRP